MVYTNFPSGVTSFGVPQIGNGLPITSGTYWFVSSVTGSNGNPGNDASLPFAGLQTAITASASGDVIVVMPGHAETVSAAAGITTTGKPGLYIIGQGEGSTRPTFTFSTSTAATFAIASAGVTLANIVGVCNIDQIVSPFVISAADCTFGLPGLPVEWHDGASNKEALRAVLTTAAADRLNVNLVYFGFTAGSHGVNAIRLVGCDNGQINILYYGILTTAVVEFVTTASTDVNVTGYTYVSGVTNGSKDVVDTVGGSTWSLDVFDGSAGSQISGGSAVAVGPGFTPAASAALPAFGPVKTAAVMVSGNTLFTVAGGPIRVESLFSLCITANGATASTVAYNSVPTIGTSTAIATASASIANAAAGATITAVGSSAAGVAQAAVYNANGPGFFGIPSSVLVPVGTITITVAVGSTTGTWQHFIRYVPLAAGVTVT